VSGHCRQFVHRRMANCSKEVPISRQRAASTREGRGVSWALTINNFAALFNFDRGTRLTGADLARPSRRQEFKFRWTDARRKQDVSLDRRPRHTTISSGAGNAEADEGTSPAI
jgi:hypothetical protein